MNFSLVCYLVRRRYCKMVNKSFSTQNSKMHSNSPLLLARIFWISSNTVINSNLESTTSHSRTCGTTKRRRDVSTMKTRKLMIHTSLKIMLNTTKLQRRQQVEIRTLWTDKDIMHEMISVCQFIMGKLDKDTQYLNKKEFQERLLEYNCCTMPSKPIVSWKPDYHTYIPS